jgi:hypothetical protein
MNSVHPLNGKHPMGKKPTPEHVEWQRAARERLVLVLDRLYGGNQSSLARALGVTQALVSIVVREVQPPTRNLMARLGALERVNPRWVETGEGEPLLPDVRGTLPVSDVLLPGPPAEHAALMTGERFAVASAFDRPSCYFWRLTAGHPGLAVDEWRLRQGDLLLMDTSREVTDVPAMFTGRMCALHGVCLNRTEPAYGVVTTDEKSRLVFGTPEPILRFDDLPRPYFEPSPDTPRLRTRTLSNNRRKVRNLDRAAKQTAERAADPWYALPAFNVTHVLAVQLLMVRP